MFINDSVISILISCASFKDRVSNSARFLLEETQQKVTDALYHEIKKNHEKPTKIFGHCIRALAEERRLGMVCKDLQEQIFLDWGDKLVFPDILMEMINT